MIYSEEFVLDLQRRGLQTGSSLSVSCSARGFLILPEPHDDDTNPLSMRALLLLTVFIAVGLAAQTDECVVPQQIGTSRF